MSCDFGETAEMPTPGSGRNGREDGPGSAAEAMPPRLEAAGLVARERDAEDERVVRIELTTAGKKLERKAREVPGALACRLGHEGSAAPPDELGRPRDAIRKLTRALQESDPD